MEVGYYQGIMLYLLGVKYAITRNDFIHPWGADHRRIFISDGKKIDRKTEEVI